MLILALNKACSHNEIAETLEVLPDTIRSPESAFKCFVNKLGHICDSERGGATVTAFAVLQLPNGGIQYRFASNQLSQDYLDITRRYITVLLNLLGQTVNENLRSIDSRILRMALDYCSSRVSVYIRRLDSDLSYCIELCEQDRESEDEKSL